MGRVVFELDDPDVEGKLKALEHRARLFGSEVVPLAYPGQPIQVFVGTNHAYQYEAKQEVEN